MKSSNIIIEPPYKPSGFSIPYFITWINAVLLFNLPQVLFVAFLLIVILFKIKKIESKKLLLLIFFLFFLTLITVRFIKTKENYRFTFAIERGLIWQSPVILY